MKRVHFVSLLSSGSVDVAEVIVDFPKQYQDGPNRRCRMDLWALQAKANQYDERRVHPNSIRINAQSGFPLRKPVFFSLLREQE